MTSSKSSEDLPQLEQHPEETERRIIKNPPDLLPNIHHLACIRQIFHQDKSNPHSKKEITDNNRSLDFTLLDRLTEAIHGIVVGSDGGLVEHPRLKTMVPEDLEVIGDDGSIGSISIDIAIAEDGELDDETDELLKGREETGGILLRVIGELPGFDEIDLGRGIIITIEIIILIRKPESPGTEIGIEIIGEEIALEYEIGKTRIELFNRDLRDDVPDILVDALHAVLDERTKIPGGLGGTALAGTDGFTLGGLPGGLGIDGRTAAIRIVIAVGPYMVRARGAARVKELLANVEDMYVLLPGPLGDGRIDQGSEILGEILG